MALGRPKIGVTARGCGANSLLSGSTEFFEGSTNLHRPINRITMEFSRGGKIRPLRPPIPVAALSVGARVDPWAARALLAAFLDRGSGKSNGLLWS